MLYLLNLLAAIALLVWGTHLVRTGILKVFGAGLRRLIQASTGTRASAALAGLGVTALVQSSGATSLIASSFVSQGLMSLASALAVLRGADVGTGLVTLLFSFNLAWLSPLLLLAGVVLHLSQEGSTAGRLGGVLIGLGIITLALRLIGLATEPLLAAPQMKLLLGGVRNDAPLELLVGAVLALMSYSSLAAVLLTAALASTGVVSLEVAFGLVLGANVGSGLSSLLTTLHAPIEGRRVQLGNFLFKLAGGLLAAPFVHSLAQSLGPLRPGAGSWVVLFHLSFNLACALLFLPATGAMARLVGRWGETPAASPNALALHAKGPRHLDPEVLDTPQLAMSCAAREALHQADLVETMLRGLLPVMRDNDLALSAELRRLDDQVDTLYSAIKYYLTKIQRSSLSEREGRRWADILAFTINMEQIGDAAERVLQDLEDKKIRPGRNFSEAGITELAELHGQLLSNHRLAMSVFLSGNEQEARDLLAQKRRFRDRVQACAANHFDRLHGNTPESIQTSSLHLDLLTELRRINSQLCSIAYPTLEAAAVRDAAQDAPPVSMPAASRPMPSRSD
ncbi:MAG TPA: Na/Pi cotransporter family protein [Ideonella sp.]|uniref:Na/Pi cotransporter family protein n=1 Tax=Ideonella sp. TaxID=1929293 RepID=UPI002CDC175C|nr:Na/Pi cotransporter family protein [Ideonella sp.]HSI50774.1 Na/Pi cotransporter family protein [Ideonella sp.]